MSQPLPPDVNPDREQRLADLLARLTEQRQDGQPLDLHAVTQEHPDLADELRELLGVARLADNAARAGVTGRITAGRTNPVAPSPAAPSLPRPFANYELRREIGRGGMGVVYQALDPRLGRFVALKMILGGEHASAEDLGRFRGEAQAIARLTHPNIVPVYDVGEQDGQAYFSMKYVEGITLAELIKHGPLPSRRAASYLLQISQAVHHAHQHGVVHRDLKPSNVLIDTALDQPLVTDFGLAKRVEGGTSLTGTGHVVGTPSYMAPEQTAGQKPLPTADVYSLGAILYEMLTGRPPFQAASVVEIILQVRSEEPVRPRLLNSRIDPDLELICLKCLEKRPEHRYASALLLAEDLRRYLNSEPVLARSSSLVYFFSRLLRETHHAPVMENWGALWMGHALFIFLFCLLTNAMMWAGVNQPVFYLALWSVGLAVWAGLFWHWRRLRGPVTFVERQIAHAWAAGVVASIGVFIVEILLNWRMPGRLPALTLTPVLAVMSGMVFLFKAGTLTGWFYAAAALCFLAAVPMALFPSIGPLLLGIVSGIGFFVPGLRYYRRRAGREESRIEP
jgi:serine/threonine-protein kinase